MGTRKHGITATQAITMFFEQIKINKGIPFDFKLPNDETIESKFNAGKNNDLDVIELSKLTQ